MSGKKAAAVAAVAAVAAFSLSYLVDKLGELDKAASPRKPRRRSCDGKAPRKADVDASSKPGGADAEAPSPPGMPPVDPALRDALRRTWLSATDHPEFRADALVARYLQLRAMPSPPVGEVVTRDVPRTFPKSAMLATDESKQCLQRVLEAYALHDPSVSYVQGMNFLAGFLMHFVEDEGEVFVMLVRLMQHPRMYMRRLFVGDLPEVAVMGHVVMSLIRQHLPDVAEHFDTIGCEATYFFEWTFTVFTYTLPIPLVADVWTEFFANGWVSIYRVVIALLQYSKPYFLGTDLHTTISVLKGFHANRLAQEFPDAVAPSPAPAPAPTATASPAATAASSVAAAVTPPPSAGAGAGAGASDGGADTPGDDAAAELLATMNSVLHSASAMAHSGWSALGSWVGGLASRADAGAGTTRRSVRGHTVVEADQPAAPIQIAPPKDLIARSRAIAISTTDVAALRAAALAALPPSDTRRDTGGPHTPMVPPPITPSQTPSGPEAGGGVMPVPFSLPSVPSTVTPAPVYASDSDASEAVLEEAADLPVGGVDDDDTVQQPPTPPSPASV